MSFVPVLRGIRRYRAPAVGRITSEESNQSWWWNDFLEATEVMNRDPEIDWPNFQQLGGRVLWSNGCQGAHERFFWRYTPPFWWQDGMQEPLAGGKPDFTRRLLVPEGFARNYMKAISIGAVRVEGVEHKMKRNHGGQPLFYARCPLLPLFDIHFFGEGETLSYWCVTGYNAEEKQIYLADSHDWMEVDIDRRVPVCTR